MSLFSFTFVGFAALLVIVYFLVPKRCQWMVLLVASVGFYLTGGWQGIFYILITIASIYGLGRLLQRQNDHMAQRLNAAHADPKQKREIRKLFAGKKKLFVWAAVVINLGIFCFERYANPGIELINDIFGAQLDSFDLLVPLGLSYYTFKSIGYVIDVYRGRVKAEKNPFKLALYVAYFPALIQGPIDRYEHLAHELFQEHAFSYERLKFGAQRMLWGYIKKMVIADRIAIFVNEVIGNYATQGYGGFTVILGVVLYSFELYADFSGGIDIVCGLSEIFDISLTENFRQPFFAASVAEYWQRWHISLGAWMRTYVFYPLSLSPTFTKLGRWIHQHTGAGGKRVGRLVAPALASFVTFVLIGIWHGSGWQYVWWGVYMALFVSTGTLFEDLYAKGRGMLRLKETSVGLGVFRVVRTFLIIAMIRFVTLSASMEDAFALAAAAFGSLDVSVFGDGSLFTHGLNEPNFWFMGLSIGVLLAVDYLHERGISLRKAIAKQHIVVRWAIYYAAIFSLIIFGVYGPGYNAANFIYQAY